MLVSVLTYLKAALPYVANPALVHQMINPKYRTAAVFTAITTLIWTELKTLECKTVRQKCNAET